MIQEIINNIYAALYPRWIVMYRLHLMFEDNREKQKEEKRYQAQKKKYEKWYAKHGEEYEADLERDRQAKKRREEKLVLKMAENARKREQEKHEMRVKEQNRLEKEAMREAESKLKRKTLNSPRLLALRRRQLTMKEGNDFELYSEGFDSGDTAQVSAFNWIMANKE